MSRIEVQETQEHTSTQVQLPVARHQLRNFIAGLLGQPQTIRREIRGAFEFRRDDVSNIHALLEQRLTEQNDAQLVSFAAIIYFDDRSSVTLNSKEQFDAYNEIRSIRTVALGLTWGYLVQFPDREYPERQEIEVALNSWTANMSRELIILSSSPFDSPALISISIRHTARSWGADIESLLNGHLKTYVQESGVVRAWLSRTSERVGLGFGIFCFLASMIAAFGVTEHASKARTELMQSKLASMQSISEKVDMIANEIAGGQWAFHYFQFAVFLFVILVLSVTAGAMVGIMAHETPKGHILLTKFDEIELAKARRAQKQHWPKLISSVVGTLITGVIANYVFLWLRS